MAIELPAGQMGCGRFFNPLLAVFLLVFAGCSGGGGGGADVPNVSVDIHVSAHYLDRVYDDDQRYYRIEAVTNDTTRTVSVTREHDISEGFWTSDNTWAFDTVIEVPEGDGTFYFVLHKVANDQDEDFWASENFGQSGQQDYRIDLIPEFSKMHYHIEGVILKDNGSFQGVDVILIPGGRSCVTDSLGAYSFSDVPNGTYTVKPEKDGYTFTPSSREVTIKFASSLMENFDASQP